MVEGALPDTSFGSAYTANPNNLTAAGFQTSASSTRKTLHSQQVRHIELYRRNHFSKLMIGGAVLARFEEIEVDEHGLQVWTVTTVNTVLAPATGMFNVHNDEVCA